MAPVTTSLNPRAPVWGLYQPDAIATMQVDGEIYLLTADEGDPRDCRGHSEVKKAGKTKLPNGISEQDQKRLSRLEISVSEVDRARYHVGDVANLGVDALHLCKRADARRQDPLRVAHSLLYQLALKAEAVRAVVFEWLLGKDSGEGRER